MEAAGSSKVLVHIKIHGAIFHKIIISIITTARASNLNTEEIIYMINAECFIRL
jgi:hypothetical protein